VIVDPLLTVEVVVVAVCVCLCRYVALLSAVLFLTHTMWFFWNYYEVPAFEAGAITALQPRARIIGSILNFSDAPAMPGAYTELCVTLCA
jgi:hypothetical protein